MRHTKHDLRGTATRDIPRSLAITGLALSLSLGVGCGSDTTGPLADTIKDGYWTLQLNHRAITMSLTAPSNQLQLQATPLTVRGDTIPTTNKIRYTSNDSSVLVDSTGLLIARLARTGVAVVARLTIPNDEGQQVTLVDTAIVNVNAVAAPVPVFTTLQIKTPGDSATFSPVPFMTGFTVTTLAASNTPLTGVNVFCRSSNSTVVDYGRGKVNNFTLSNFARLPGLTILTCSATIYGVSLSDTLPIHIGMPLWSKLTVDTMPVVSGSPPVVVSTSIVKIGIGGIIQWDNNSKRTVDLVFDDSMAPQSVPASERVLGSGIIGFPCLSASLCHLPTGMGNVLLPPANNAFLLDGVGRDFRKFPVTGTYSYHSVTYPTLTGTIVVQ